MFFFFRNRNKHFIKKIVKKIKEASKEETVKNILKVHNRNHPKKREYVVGEVGKSNASKHRRQANPKWIALDKKAQANLAMIGKSQTKFNTWR